MIPRTLLAAAIVALAGAADAKAECGRLVTKAGNADYCVEQGSNQDLLYFFHGATPPGSVGMERQWISGAGDELKQLWRAQHRSAPSVAAVTFGPTFVLKGAGLEAFGNEVAPTIERRHLSPLGRRLVLGASLGGYNAFLLWALKPYFVSAAAFQCPAFLPVSPFIPIPNARLLQKQWTNIQVGINVLKPLFRSSAEWQVYQPRAVMRRLSGHILPPAYMVYNTRDSIGLTSAPEIAAAGQRITVEAVDGDHCEHIATPGLAQFLSRSDRGAP